MQVISPYSTEYIRVPVSASGYTVTQIKACTVAMAVVPFGYEPSAADWNTAGWSESSNAEAILMVGPGGNINLASESAYDVWVKITVTGQTGYVAILRSGTIRTSKGTATSVLPAAQYDQRAKVVNIGCNYGDDLVVSFTVTEDGDAYNWTGVTVEGQVRPSDTSSVVLATFTFDTSTNGVLVASLDDTIIESLGEDSVNYYSIRITKNTITRTWVKGQLVVAAVATQ